MSMRVHMFRVGVSRRPLGEYYCCVSERVRRSPRGAPCGAHVNIYMLDAALYPRRPHVGRHRDPSDLPQM